MAFSFSGARRVAGSTYEWGSAACTIPVTAAMKRSCVSIESGWFTRIWFRTWLNICRSSNQIRVNHPDSIDTRSEEHTSELQSLAYLVCRLLLEKKKKKQK